MNWILCIILGFIIAICIVIDFRDLWIKPSLTDFRNYLEIQYKKSKPVTIIYKNNLKILRKKIMDEKLNALREFAICLMRSGADLLSCVDGLKCDFDTENKTDPNYNNYCDILARTRKSYREEVLRVDFGMHMTEEEKKLWNNILKECEEE